MNKVVQAFAILAWCVGVWVGYALLIHYNENLSWDAMVVLLFVASPLLALLALVVAVVLAFGAVATMLFTILLPFGLGAGLVKSLREMYANLRR